MPTRPHDRRSSDGCSSWAQATPVPGRGRERAPPRTEHRTGATTALPETQPRASATGVAGVATSPTRVLAHAARWTFALDASGAGEELRAGTHADLPVDA